MWILDFQRAPYMVKPYGFGLSLVKPFGDPMVEFPPPKGRLPPSLRVLANKNFLGGHVLDRKDLASESRRV